MLKGELSGSKLGGGARCAESSLSGCWLAGWRIHPARASIRRRRWPRFGRARRDSSHVAPENWATIPLPRCRQSIVCTAGLRDPCVSPFIILYSLEPNDIIVYPLLAGDLFVYLYLRHRQLKANRRSAAHTPSGVIRFALVLARRFQIDLAVRCTWAKSAWREWDLPMAPAVFC